MSLLRNAINSIELGVEDFQNSDPRRAASAVRNFFAGVLLLLKEKLRQESPAGSDEALVYERIVFVKDPSDEVVFKGAGKKTVDVAAIKDRYRSLGLALDEAPLDKLQQIRNDIEHYDASRHPHAKVQEAIANTFVLVARVLEDHLGSKPAAVFAPGVWQTMIKEAGTYKDIEQRCRESKRDLENVPDAAKDLLDDFECPECSSPLLRALSSEYVDSEFECCVCGEVTHLASLVPAALESAYAGESYEAAKDGGPQPIGTCPTCGEEAFHVEDDVCLVCVEGRPYTECARCSADLDLDEQESGMCSYCDHMHAKMMAD
jgi:hypothetical protein